MSVRFEGNCAETNRRKERVALKRQAKAAVAEVEDSEEESPEERSFREDQEALALEDDQAHQDALIEHSLILMGRRKFTVPTLDDDVEPPLL
jgi:hypothetical protein